MEYVKDFKGWEPVKRHLNQAKAPHYKEREIWWAHIGVNIGSEQDGKGARYTRPILIIQGFSRELFWGVPLSTTPKRSEYHFPFELRARTSVALLSQLRAFDARRLDSKLAVMPVQEFTALKMQVRRLLTTSVL